MTKKGGKNGRDGTESNGLKQKKNKQKIKGKSKIM